MLVKASDTSALAEDDGRYIIRPAFPFQEKTQFESYTVEIRPGGSLQAQPHMRGTEEFLTVFSGELEVTAGNEQFLISAGDSLRFQADVAHAYKNAGSDTVHLHMIIHYQDK